MGNTCGGGIFGGGKAAKDKPDDVSAKDNPALPKARATPRGGHAPLGFTEAPVRTSLSTYSARLGFHKLKGYAAGLAGAEEVGVGEEAAKYPFTKDRVEIVAHIRVPLTTTARVNFVNELLSTGLRKLRREGTPRAIPAESVAKALKLVSDSSTWGAGGSTTLVLDRERSLPLRLTQVEVVVLEMWDRKLPRTSPSALLGGAVIVPETYLPPLGGAIDPDIRPKFDADMMPSSVFVEASMKDWVDFAAPGKDLAVSSMQLSVDIKTTGRIGSTSAADHMAQTINRSRRTLTDIAKAVVSPPFQIKVMPHRHTKFCDRTKQVCTAMDAFREGNVLSASTTGVPIEDGHECVITWFRSEKKFPWGTGASATASGASGTAATAHADGSSSAEVKDDSADGEGAAASTWVTELSGIHVEMDDGPIDTSGGGGGGGGGDSGGGASSGSGDGDDEAKEAVKRAIIRNPDGSITTFVATSGKAGLPEIPEFPGLKREAVEAAISGKGSSTDATISTSTGAVCTILALAAKAESTPSERLLSLADVGYRFFAEVQIPGRGVLRSQVTQPIEPANPRAREVWVKGDIKVGGWLTVHVYYYGGVQGPSAYLWTRVTEEGDREAIGTSQEIDPTIPLPDPMVDEDAAHADPRCYKVKPGDMGCVFKVEVHPVRSDGVKGAPTTSRPTREVEG